MANINLNHKILVIGLGSMGKRRIMNLQLLGFKNIKGFDAREDRRNEVKKLHKIESLDSIDKVRITDIRVKRD